jgi:hypothetical protein
LRVVSETLVAWSRIGWLNAVVSLAGLLLLAAAVTFVLNMWGRVRELGGR